MMTGAYEYARALFMISEEEHSSDRVMADVKLAKEAFASNPTYADLLDTPALDKSERLSLIDKAFSSLDVSLVNLIKILAEKRLSYLFPKLADEYAALYDESRGILRAEAVTAIPLTETQSKTLTRKLSALTGKTVILSNTTDKSILGGALLRYSGIQLDGSVKTRLDKFEAALKSAVI